MRRASSSLLSLSSTSVLFYFCHLCSLFESVHFPLLLILILIVLLLFNCFFSFLLTCAVLLPVPQFLLYTLSVCFSSTIVHCTIVLFFIFCYFYNFFPIFPFCSSSTTTFVSSSADAFSYSNIFLLLLVISSACSFACSVSSSFRFLVP